MRGFSPTLVPASKVLKFYSLWLPRTPKYPSITLSTLFIIQPPKDKLSYNNSWKKIWKKANQRQPPLNLLYYSHPSHHSNPCLKTFPEQAKQCKKNLLSAMRLIGKKEVCQFPLCPYWTRIKDKKSALLKSTPWMETILWQRILNLHFEILFEGFWHTYKGGKEINIYWACIMYI